MVLALYFVQPCSVRFTDSNEFEVFFMRFDGVKMFLGDAATSDQRYLDFAIDNCIEHMFP
jgi:hypothetical protein